jgi:signal transduction histidine kinase/ActR/RegA family two-component response regulator
MALDPCVRSDSTRLQAAIARWLSELTRAGMFATDAELKVVAWNRWMEVHTHRPASEILGRPLLEAFPELTTREIDRRYRAALEHGRVSTLSHGLHGYVLAVAPTHPDLGLSQMPQTCHIGPLLDGETIVGTVTTIENVSERLMNEAELRRQIEAHQIARTAAETALRAKDDFLSTLSHELRTPLNAVLGWARILQTRKERDPKLIERALDVIERNAAAQAAMIDDILDVARIVSGKLRLEMQSTDLMHVILAAVDVVTPSAKAKRLEVRTNLDSETPHVLGDPGRLQQIVWNLLSNAVKFSDPGGVIDIDLAPCGASVRLAVRDSGHGISPEFLPFVFDRFRQSDASSARRQGGLGLGLALVRDLVQLHGGTIRVDSAGEQQGAEFTIELPTAIAAVLPPRYGNPNGRSVSETPSLVGVLALVVEDERDSRDMLMAALTRCGAQVEAVASCDAALELLAESRAKGFDVLVSDIGMPQRDGYELIREVRALEQDHLRRIPAIALTGYVTPADRSRILAAGYHGHVPKPIDPMAVAFEIQRVIREAATPHPRVPTAS